MTRPALLLRWLCSLGAREASPTAGEQMASLQFHSTPRLVNRKGDAA